MFEHFRRTFFPTQWEVFLDVCIYGLIPFALLILIVIGLPMLLVHISEKSNRRMERKRLKESQKVQAVERIEKQTISNELFTGKCPQCGSTIERQFVVCPYCGLSLVASSKIEKEIIEKRSSVESK